MYLDEIRDLSRLINGELAFSKAKELLGEPRDTVEAIKDLIINALNSSTEHASTIDALKDQVMDAIDSAFNNFDVQLMEINPDLDMDQMKEEITQAIKDYIDSPEFEHDVVTVNEDHYNDITKSEDRDQNVEQKSSDQQTERVEEFNIFQNEKEVHTYDKDGKLTRVETFDKASGSLIDRSEYVRDESGNRIEHYNKEGQLTSVSHFNENWLQVSKDFYDKDGKIERVETIERYPNDAIKSIEVRDENGDIISHDDYKYNDHPDETVSEKIDNEGFNNWQIETPDRDPVEKPESDSIESPDTDSVGEADRIEIETDANDGQNEQHVDVTETDRSDIDGIPSEDVSDIDFDGTDEIPDIYAPEFDSEDKEQVGVDNVVSEGQELEDQDDSGVSTDQDSMEQDFDLPYPYEDNPEQIDEAEQNGNDTERDVEPDPYQPDNSFDADDQTDSPDLAGDSDYPEIDVEKCSDIDFDDCFSEFMNPQDIADQEHPDVEVEFEHDDVDNGISAEGRDVDDYTTY